MPDVVFFGGSVARPKVKKCLDAVAVSNALLVVGSSLSVYSGFRFCRHAHKLGVPIGIINTGPTRADELALMSITDDAATVLRQEGKVNSIGLGIPYQRPAIPGTSPVTLTSVPVTDKILMLDRCQ